jgi:hypothetical protein
LLLLRIILISLVLFSLHFTTSYVSVQFLLVFVWFYRDCILLFLLFTHNRNISCLLDNPPTSCFVNYLRCFV